LISRTDLPVGQDSLPLHLLAGGDRETEQAIIPVLLGLPSLLEQYSQWLASLHPDLIKELRSMTKKKDKGPVFHLDALVELVGAKHVIEEVGAKRFVEALGPDRVIEELKGLRGQLTPKQKQMLKELGS